MNCIVHESNNRTYNDIKNIVLYIIIHTIGQHSQHMSLTKAFAVNLPHHM